MHLLRRPGSAEADCVRASGGGAGSHRYFIESECRTKLSINFYRLFSADKLLDESIWSLGYHFVSAEKLGGLEALMAELTGYIAAQARIRASA